jgi:ketosteroid isomerase-like protein
MSGHLGRAYEDPHRSTQGARRESCQHAFVSVDFMQMEAAILHAIVEQDWDSVSALLDDDFVITTAGWLESPATKESWIAAFADRLLLHRFDIRSLETRDLGSVVVVLMLSTQWATWKGAPFKGDFRYTDVWRASDGGKWRLAVRHASLLPAD